MTRWTKSRTETEYFTTIAQAADPAREIGGVPTSIHDGDTFRLGEIRVRLWGMNALELAACFGHVARQRLVELIDRRAVRCGLTGFMHLAMRGMPNRDHAIIAVFSTIPWDMAMFKQTPAGSASAVYNFAMNYFASPLPLHALRVSPVFSYGETPRARREEKNGAEKGACHTGANRKVPAWLLAASPVFAGSATWLNAPGSGDWNTDGNWSAVLRSCASHSVLVLVLAVGVFAPAYAAPYNAATEAELINAITLANADGDASSTITLTNNVTIASPASLPSVTKPLTVDTGAFTLATTGNSTLNAGAGSTLTFSGSTSGTGNLIANGAGTVAFSGVNSNYAGNITVNSGGILINGGSQLLVGNGAGRSIVMTAGNSTLVVSGAGTRLTDRVGTGSVGSVGGATLTVEGGAVIDHSVNLLALAELSGSVGTLNVTGSGSLFNGIIDVVRGSGVINVTDGGHITSNQVGIGGFANPTILIPSTGSGVVTVSGAGSRWDSATSFFLSSGSLSVLDGGVVSSGFMSIASRQNGTAATVVVSGVGSQLVTTGSGDISVGAVGDGSLTISNGGRVNIRGGAGTLSLATSASGSGALNIGGEGGDAATAAGVLDAALVQFGAGTGAVNFNHTDSAYQFAAVIAGNGAVNQTGPGTTILTADNTYTDGTTISAGTLQLGNGGTSGSIVGDITNNAALAFDRSDLASVGGVISGTGTVSQIGAGTTILTADNTYTGGTTISAGTLQLGNGGTSGNIVSDITNNAALAFDRSDIASVGGVISGTGTVSQIGAGTTILTGVNTYSGGTIIASGTLAGSATSFGTGAITDNAALVIDQPANATFANAINGTGSLTKQGVGALNYTGTGNLSGTTTVAAGLLSVNGSLANSAVTAQSGGALGGNGTVGATTIQSGGTIAPGNSIGTLHVNGTYAQASGATYQVEVDPASTASDLIAVTGTATLADGALINVTKTTNAPYVSGTKYTVLTSTSGLTGTFDLTGDTAILTPFLAFADVYDANNAYLQVVQTRTFTSVGQTPNQIATGGGLDGLPPAGALATALLNLPSEGAAREAFDQLSGEIHASAKTALIEGNRFARDAATDRVREAFCAAGAMTSQKRAASVGGGQDARKPSSTDCADSPDRFTTWGQAFGSWGHRDGDSNAAGLSRSTGGFFIGADAPTFETWRVGVLGGYSRSTFDVKGRNSSGYNDGYHVGLYGGTQMGALGFRTGATYTWHDMNTSRSVTGDQLTGDYNAGTTQIFGDLGYRINVGTVAFEPFANLAYVNLHTGSFTEQGGPAALTDHGGDTNTAFTTLGSRASTAFVLGNIETTAHGSLGWRHAFGDVTPVSTLSFAGGSAFDIQGVSLAEDAAVVDVGLDLNVTSNVVGGISYGGQFANGVIDQSVRGTLNIKF